MAAVRPEPATPSPKKKSVADPVDAIIGNLNAQYNLEIDLRDKHLSPSRRRDRARSDPHYAQCEAIYRHLHLLYYRGDVFLDTALDAFRRESKAACRKWVPKPRADRDTLPSSHGACKASTPGEKLELQDILLDALKQVKSSIQPKRDDGMSSIATDPAPEAGGSFAIPSRPSKSRSKRPSNEGAETFSKRVKSQQRQPQPDTIANAIDKVPARQRVNSPKPTEMRSAHEPPLRHSTKSLVDVSFYEASVNTSKASLVPSVFSQNNVLPASQSTIDPGTQETTKPAERGGVPPPSSEHHIPSSPGDIRTAAESFTRFDSDEADDEAALFDRDRDESVDELLDEHSPETALPGAIGPRGGPERMVSPTQSTEYSSFSGLLDFQMPDPVPFSQSDTLEARLANVWPTFPVWLHEAPLAVVWELTRLSIHCGVDINTLDLQYDPSWADSKSHRHLWSGLRKHYAFSSGAFPEPPAADAWAAAMEGFGLRNNMAVILTASLDYSPSQAGPLFLLRLHPLKLDKSSRLNRRFGSDRFFEILIPSPHNRKAPKILKDSVAVDTVIHWLTRERHSFLGRRWAAFFTSDGDYRKPVKDVRTTSGDVEPVRKERIHLFAESGRHVSPGVSSVEQMLDWLLQFKRNEDQPFLKLFSRIQLGLSKTIPAIVLEKSQMVHRKRDITSPIGKVMNDGIARVSLSIARKVQEKLGLPDPPSAIQGRIGSAKGMWIVDVTGKGVGVGGSERDWIETFPSQRKWKCEQSDEFQRTLEVHSVPNQLRSASLNLQFLPVLEDRAQNKQHMRETIGKRMADDLHDELKSLGDSMRHPIQFRQWVRQFTRGRHGEVPFLGGLPSSNEEMMNFLLDGGFDPKKQKYLQELAWDLQFRKCDQLTKKLNIRVGQSAYMYMVVDFLGVLEEDEVHVGFSSTFREGDFSDVLLHGMEVLVARSPAHLVSDVQKVRAVFKTELRALKDVIVFSAKGNVPLADKLSGGDYDGDKAWVCWDPHIVDNFVNAEVPKPPDLSPFIGKDKTTFGDLVQEVGSRSNAIQEMIERSFQFNMSQSLLGQCTNYKEKLCYWTGNIHSEMSVMLSKLLSDLVDQPKQGLLFGPEAWDRLRKHMRVPLALDDPAYKHDTWTAKEEPTNIIDYLKFSIVKKTVDRELEAFRQDKTTWSNSAEYWDPDLAKHFAHFEDMTRTSSSCKDLLDGLKISLAEVANLWSDNMSKGSSNDRDTFSDKIAPIYNKWCEIKPTFARRSRSTSTNVDSKVVSLLLEPYLGNDELSHWSLLKASMTFKMYYKSKPKFPWRIAGRQLQFIKAMVSSTTLGGVPTPVQPLMYAGLSVDKKFVARYVATMEGKSSEYMSIESEDEGGEDDDA